MISRLDHEMFGTGSVSRGVWHAREPLYANYVFRRALPEISSRYESNGVTGKLNS